MLSAIVAAFVATLPISALAQFVPPNNATVNPGALRYGGAMSTVNFTVTNVTDQLLTMVPVECTALDKDEPLETNTHIDSNLQPKETAYGSVDFFKLRGRSGLTVSCRIPYIRND